MILQCVVINNQGDTVVFCAQFNLMDKKNKNVLIFLKTFKELFKANLDCSPEEKSGLLARHLKN